MSGGHWEYEQYGMERVLKEIGRDGETILRFPKLAQIFRDLGEVLGEVVHDLDYDFSGDSSIDNDSQFENKAVSRITGVVNKKCKFKVYEIEN